MKSFIVLAILVSAFSAHASSFKCFGTNIPFTKVELNNDSKKLGNLTGNFEAHLSENEDSMVLAIVEKDVGAHSVVVAKSGNLLVQTKINSENVQVHCIQSE